MLGVQALGGPSPGRSRSRSSERSSDGRSTGSQRRAARGADEREAAQAAHQHRRLEVAAAAVQRQAQVAAAEQAQTRAATAARARIEAEALRSAERLREREQRAEREAVEAESARRRCTRSRAVAAAGSTAQVRAADASQDGDGGSQATVVGAGDGSDCPSQRTVVGGDCGDAPVCDDDGSGGRGGAGDGADGGGDGGEGGEAGASAGDDGDGGAAAGAGGDGGSAAAMCAACDEDSDPLAPLRALIPPGMELAGCPTPAQLRSREAMRGAAVMVLWPTGWFAGHVHGLHEGCEEDHHHIPSQRATHRVEYLDEAAHAYHALTASAYATAPGVDPTLVGSWALLQAVASPAAAAVPGETRCCSWGGCPGRLVRLSPASLLRHYRHVHGGDIPDDVLAWADGVRCPDCSQPHLRRGLASHLVVDPADGVRRCPSRITRTCAELRLTEADEEFVRGLTADEVYISSSHSMTHVPMEADGDYAAIVGQLMRVCASAPVGSLEAQQAWRVLHVVLAALLRPLGAQQNGAAVLARRISCLREGGRLEELWRAPVVAPRARNRRHRDAAAEADDDPAAERTRRVLDARAVCLVRAGEPGRGRAALERAGELGVVTRADVCAVGELGEVVDAVAGTVTAEMLAKHPPPAQRDRELPSAAELLGAAASGTPGHGLDGAGLRSRTCAMFDRCDLFVTYVRRLARLSMPAADAVRFEHLRPLTRHGLGADLRDFILLVALGDVPAEARPYLYGGRLVAPPKPGGGSYRPLGAGVVWRRVAAGFMASCRARSFGERLAPLQLGVGVPRGPEVFAAAIRLALEAHPDWVVVKVDFRNAFNEVSRLAFLTFVAAHFPELLLFLLAAYAAPAYITALGPDGWVRFLSRCGCTQGCPLGPLCFASAVHGVLERIRGDPRFAGCVLVALHDDLQIAGPPELVHVCLRDLIGAVRELCGLVPTGHKFGLYAPRLSHFAAPALAAVRAIEADCDSWTPPADLARGRCCRAQADGVVAAGVPMGTPQFVRDYALARLAEHEVAHERVRLLSCVQCAYVLLRLCLGARFTYLLRACGPRLRDAGAAASSPVAEHDAQQRRTLGALLRRPCDLLLRAQADPAYLSDDCYDQAVLPCALGGVHLACAAVVCEGAFLAGVTACIAFIRGHLSHFGLLDSHLSSDTSTLPLILELHRAHARWAADGGDTTSLSRLLAGTPRAQSALCGGLWERRRASLLARLDSCGRARLLSAGGQWAGHWLLALPTHHRLRATATAFSLALALRLGADIPWALGAPCRACGEALYDAWGRHPSACRKGNRGSLWDLRHLSLQDALLWVLRVLARCPSAQVARGNVLGSAAVTGVRADGSLSYRQLDLWVPHYVAPGRHLGIDVAVTDPLAVTALRSSPSSSAEAGRAATLRAEKKVAKYERIMLSVGGVFRAGVVERFGAVGDSLAGLVRQMVGDAARMGDEDDFSFTAQRQLVWAMQHVVFGAVMGDAVMLEAALERDVYGLSADGAAAARERVLDAGGAARRGAYRPRRGRGGGATGA